MRGPMEYVEFYRGRRTTGPMGYTIRQVLSFTDAELEGKHDFIQWIFPMYKLSVMQPDVARHVLTAEAVVAMQHDTGVMVLIEDAVRMMLRFWGMCWEPNTEALVYIESERRFYEKLYDGNHNQARMTRMLVFLKCLGYNGLVAGIKGVLCETSNRCCGGLAHWLDV